MAAKRIPQLDPVSAANVDNSDSLVLFDAGADETKRVLRSNLLANNSGASVVGYTQGASGASDRTVQNKLQESVSVKDFGAVGDGVTDDSTAIQAALDAVHAAGGGQLFFPAGTYTINSNLTVGDNTHIIGAARWATRLYLGNTNLIHFSGDYSKIEYCEIFKDQSNGNYLVAGVLNNSDPAQGRFTWVNACKFDCNSMPSFVNHAQIGNYKSFDIKVTNCSFQAPHLAFITKYFSSQRVTFTDNIVSLKVGDNTSAELVKIEAVYEAFINNNTFYSEGTTASSNLLSLLTLESGSYQTIVSNNKFVNDYGYGIRVENADSPTFPARECIIENNTFESDITNAYCIFSGNTATTKLSVNNNSFFGKTTLYADKSSYDSNFFYGVGDTSNTGVILRGDDISFKNNTVTGFQYGLQLASTSTALMDNLNISNNYFIGQDNDAVQLKYLNEYSSFTNNTVIHETSNGNAAIYCFGGGEAGDADTLTISNNTIVSTNVPAVYVNSMNGVTIKANSITAGTPYSLASTDAYNEDYNVFTTTIIEDISSRINTEGKHDGKMIFNTTTNKPVYATGATAGAVWVDATGATAHTPS